jgi:hypothetical protein
VRARLNLQVVRGPRITRAFPLRIPSALAPGRRRLVFVGKDVDDPDADLFGALLDTFTIGDGDKGPGPGDAGPPSLDALAARVRAIERYDGVSLHTAGAVTRAYRDPDIRISGRASRVVRVRR